MPYTIAPGTRSAMRIMTITEELTNEAMHADAELGLNAGEKLYVLLDVSGMGLGLPDGFLDGARSSFFVNANLGHLALYTRSDTLRTIGDMVARLTRRREKLSVHRTYAEALSHLERMLDAEGK